MPVKKTKEKERWQKQVSVTFLAQTSLGSLDESNGFFALGCVVLL